MQTIPLSRDITESENEFLTKQDTDDEIFKAVKQINSLKAPGPNVMQAVFYQNVGILSVGVCKMVKSFFNLGYMLKKIK